MKSLKATSESEAIDIELLKGTPKGGGKQRIYDFFTQDHTRSEKAAFLKKEYGYCGSSPHDETCEYFSWIRAKPAKGIIFERKGSCENKVLSWVRVAARIEHFIANGTWMGR